MNATTRRALIKDCIRFYEKRRWNWVGAVGWLCHQAIGEQMEAEARAMAEALKGLKYRRK